MMKRREFVATAGVATALTMVPRSLRGAPPFGRALSGSVPPGGALNDGASGLASLSRIGLETYSVRDKMRADPDGTLRAIRAMGYDDVELLWSFNNFDRTTAQVKAVLTSSGLRASSAHIAPTLLQSDWAKALDTAAELGHEYLIVPSLPAETDRSLDAWKKWADIFNTAGAAARKHSLWLAFHNEPNHMKVMDGQVAYDVFLARTDATAVRLQLDVGNMLMGGSDPLPYLKAHQDRYHSFHLKDVVADRKRDTELGTGILDAKQFLTAVKDLGKKTVFVEQEGAKDSMASAKQNLDYLRGLRF
jgi:sugar phosphate isomerase/epimerase